MNLICLAAGKGSRFGNLGGYLQKCMYPIGLNPFLELSVRNLTMSGIDLSTSSLTLVVGHFKEQIQSYFGDSYNGLKINYVVQDAALGTGHAIQTAYQKAGLTGPCVVWLADGYVKPTQFSAILAHKMPIVQSVAADRDPAHAKIRVSLNDHQITQAWEGDSDYVDIGLWKFSEAMVKRMTGRKEVEYRIMPNLQDAIMDGENIGYLIEDEWLHLGGTEPTPEINTLRIAQRVRVLEGLEAKI
ncbi:NTP transferase domain-containing protein [Yoonia sp. R2331]|uniref:NTP transferase domain-containing protein n=1 Tax=Yoonia sp. R2331 TaxID=3237238 RepID=UPI0034E3D74E